MYQSLEARLHDIFWDAEAPGVELELIQKHLENHPGRSLEIGCGSGRILLPLNEMGHATDGNDVSADMLDLLDKGDFDVEIHHGVTTEQDVSHYQNFLVPAFTFMLFEEGEVEKTLNYLQENGAEGANLYLTLFMPWAEICGELDEEDWYIDHKTKMKQGGEAVCRTSFTIDRTHQQLKRLHRYTLTEANGKKEKYESVQNLRWFTFMEMDALLEKTGWKVKQTIFDLDPESDSENAHLYTFIAEKI